MDGFVGALPESQLKKFVESLAGGTLAGITGMFLSLPVIAVLKIVFDRSEGFKKWGVLFGDEKPKFSPMSFPVFRLRSRRVQESLQQQNDIKPTNIKGEE